MQSAQRTNSFARKATSRAKGKANWATRFMVRRPAAVMACALAVAISLSTVGMIVGEFKVGADNEDWSTRGTKIANREKQNEKRMSFYEDMHGAHDNHDDHDHDRSHPEGDEGDDGQSNTQTFAAPQAARRKLLQDDASTGFHHMKQGDIFGGDLRIVWKAADDANAFLMSYGALKDLCALEEQVMQLPGYEETCRPQNGEDGRACEHPMSVTTALQLFARDAPESAWLSCEALFAKLGEGGVNDAIAELKAYYRAMGSSQSDLNYPEMQSWNFLERGIVGTDMLIVNDTKMLSSSFQMTFDEGRTLDFVIQLHNAGHIKALAAPHLKTSSYGTQDEGFEDKLMDDILNSDLIYSTLASFVILLLMWVHTRSVFLAVIGFIQVALSFPLAYFVYKIILGFEFFPFLNFLAIFVVMGIGADDVFVLFDKFEQHLHAAPVGTSIEEIACAAIPEASYSMLLTSVTTAGAFFATSIAPISPIRLFAIFMGLMILFDYFMVVIICAPAHVLQYKWLEATRTGNATRIGVLKRCRYALIDYTLCCCCGGGGRGKPIAGEADTDTSLQKWLVGFASVVVKLRYIVLVVFFGLFAYCGMVSADIPMPKTSEVKVLPDSHIITKFNEARKDLLDSYSDESISWVAVIWGLIPADTGDHNNPDSYTEIVFDGAFDPTSVAAQTFLLDFCEDVANQSFVVGQSSCVMQDFDHWLFHNSSPRKMEACGDNTGLPLAPSRFVPCLTEYYEGRSDTALGFQDGELKFISFEFKTDVSWRSSYSELKRKYLEWSDYLNAKQADAPAGVNKGFFSSGDFHWWDTMNTMGLSAYTAAFISMACATAVVFISNRNLIITMWSVVSIFGVLTLVAATSVWFGWTLGFLEAICFAILVGWSCDFTIHFAHAFAEAGGTAQDKAIKAIKTMGPPILFAAITTACSGVFLFMCTITFYQKFGTIIIFTMAYSLVTVFVFLVALLAVAGPAGFFGAPFEMAIKRSWGFTPRDGVKKVRRPSAT